MTTPSSLRLIVLASGRGSNLQALIDATANESLKSKIAAVISDVPGAHALERAKQAGIPTFAIPGKGQPKIKFFNEMIATIDNLEPDLIVLAGFMRILPPDFIEMFEGKIINIHPALLPKFPGLHAQKQALDAGETETGCTVHWVDAGMDTGPAILQRKISILPNDTEDTLSARLLPIEHEALVKAVRLIESGEISGSTPL